MSVDVEAKLTQSLRASMVPVATGESIPECEQLRQFELALQCYVPGLLGWRHESFDAFRFCRAIKQGATEAEFLGLALLITDQAWTPFWLRIGISVETDAVSYLDCKVGERGDGLAGMVRTPYNSSRVGKLLDSLPGRLWELQWAYRTSI